MVRLSPLSSRTQKPASRANELMASDAGSTRPLEDLNREGPELTKSSVESLGGVEEDT